LFLICCQLHRYAVVVLGEAGFGELEFQFCEHVDGGQNRLGLRADALRHFQEDAVDLC
jgi:hypothetical protein